MFKVSKAENKFTAEQKHQTQKKSQLCSSEQPYIQNNMEKEHFLRELKRRSWGSDDCDNVENDQVSCRGLFLRKLQTKPSASYSRKITRYDRLRDYYNVG